MKTIIALLFIAFGIACSNAESNNVEQKEKATADSINALKTVRQ